MMRKILLDGREICYELEHRNVKNINIRIKPGGKVYVSADRRVPSEYIEKLFNDRKADILKAVKKYETVKPEAPETLRDGSTVWFLGRQLRIRTESAESNMVTREGDTLIVYSAGSSTDAIVNAWYDVQCRRLLPDMCHRMYQRFSDLVEREPVYSFKRMKSRWGSCSPAKYRMSLNTELVKYSEKLIEFVLCHEYSHFIHPDHSPAFYEFMSSMMPDHRERKAELKKTAEMVGSFA